MWGCVCGAGKSIASSLDVTGAVRGGRRRGRGRGSWSAQEKIAPDEEVWCKVVVVVFLP
jgi:hypothetical protein